MMAVIILVFSWCSDTMMCIAYMMCIDDGVMFIL